MLLLFLYGFLERLAVLGEGFRELACLAGSIKIVEQSCPHIAFSGM